jgi:hypothetical protein
MEGITYERVTIQGTFEGTRQPSVARDLEFFPKVTFVELHMITQKGFSYFIRDRTLSKTEHCRRQNQNSCLLNFNSGTQTALHSSKKMF